ncbi:MAG: ABC transporter permease, partial [Peptostreptococcus sp.]|nr:ABC transporter permease [Peptostreptococcus sp.]
MQNVYLVLVFIFLYAPIAALIIFSFNDSKSMGHLNGFTLKWYAALFKNGSILSALYYTVTIAILASVISTIFGTISSIGIYKMRG